MKYCIIFFLLSPCLALSAPEVDPGECVLGAGKAVWRMLFQEKETYLFVQYPPLENSRVHSVTDLSTFKKVECPNLGQ